MSIKVDWDNENKTTILYIFQGSWRWDDLYASIDKANAMIAGVDHEVHAIIDMQDSSFVPTDLLSRIGNFRTRIRPNAGVHVLVGTNLFIQTVYNMYCKIDPRGGEDFEIVSTLDEARELLANIEVE